MLRQSVNPHGPVYPSEVCKVHACQKSKLRASLRSMQTIPSIPGLSLALIPHVISHFRYWMLYMICLVLRTQCDVWGVLGCFCHREGVNLTGDQEWAEPEGESQVRSVLQQLLKRDKIGFRRWKTPSLGPEKPALRCVWLNWTIRSGMILREC